MSTCNTTTVTVQDQPYHVTVVDDSTRVTLSDGANTVIVADPSKTLTVIEKAVEVVQVAGDRGPQGPPGQDGADAVPHARTVSAFKADITADDDVIWFDTTNNTIRAYLPPAAQMAGRTMTFVLTAGSKPAGIYGAGAQNGYQAGEPIGDGFAAMVYYLNDAITLTATPTGWVYV